ncbi:MAG: fibronectin type III-like domain-contianing protein, partial [Alistipes sp.]|nr:fibronectin type III-like domain-contianing protein [Alistipes sp.]
TLRIVVPVTNTGAREGAEVVQLYIRDVESSLPRPVKELKGFRKVTLAPGETQEVVFDIDRDALCFFDDARHAWVAEPGRFEAWVASSAADIRGKVVFELK